MRLELVFGAAFLLNAFGICAENQKLVAALMTATGFCYGFGIGWWAYGQWHGVF